MGDRDMVRRGPVTTLKPSLSLMHQLSLRSGHNASASPCWVMGRLVKGKLVVSGDGEMADKETSGRPKGRRMPKHGEYGYRYGTRHFIATQGQGLIAQDDKWHLVAVPSRDRPNWHNFKLYLNAKAPKNLFHIGISKGKIAQLREAKALEEYYPGRQDWVLEQALLYIDGKLPLRKEKGRRIVYVNHKGWVPVIKEQK